MTSAPRLHVEPTSTAGVEHLLTAREVADILGVREKRVYELGIPEVRISVRSVRYRPSDLETWIQQRRRSA